MMMAMAMAISKPRLTRGIPLIFLRITITITITITVLSSLHSSAEMVMGLVLPTASTPSLRKRRRWGMTVWSTSTITKDNSSYNDNDKANIRVWDNVLSPDLCEELQVLATDHDDRVESSIFTRYPHSTGNNPHNDRDLTPLEQAIDSILTEIESSPSSESYSKTGQPMNVEYWSRHHHANLDVHSDVDEEEFLEEGIIRMPRHGHVLYLRVGSEIQGCCDSNASGADGIERGRSSCDGEGIIGTGGPTVVFPEKSGGWGENRLKEEEEKEKGGNSGSNRDYPNVVELVTVPAVEGRLLRFHGSLMHAVPCPSLRWIQSDDTNDNHVDGDDYNDDDYDGFVSDEQCRSVLLFNTWPAEDGPPPRGVNPDPISGKLPTGIDFGDDDDDDDPKPSIVGKDADEDDDDNFMKCEARSKWQDATICVIPNGNGDYNAGDDRETKKKILGKIPLLGNAKRRGSVHKKVAFFGDERLKEALQQRTVVSKLCLMVN